MTKGHDKGHKGQMSDREVMKLALEALEDIHPGNMTPMAEEYWGKAITALRQALEQPEQEPVAWLDKEMDMAYTVNELPDVSGTSFIPLYTAPPKREWQWLTDEEIMVCGGMDGADNWVFQFANALQIKLREKNHG